MTISSEVRKAGPFSGNDITTSFPFAFKVFSTADVLVVLADSVGSETDLVEGVDYTVTLNANQNANPGGTVNKTTPLVTGEALVITSQVQNLQPTDLTNQGGFYPAVINAALDRATIQIQQLAEQLARSAKLPITRTEDVDALLNDIVVLADNLTDISTVAGGIGNVGTVSGISADVSTVAGISTDVTEVSGISADVSAVSAVASDIPTVAASASNVDAVAGDIANVNTVAANIANVNAVGPDIADVSTVAANIANINAAVADLPSLAAKVSKTGDTMTGPLSVPAGASGSQVPQAQETYGPKNGQLAGMRNKIINGAFGINQRTYVSGAATTAGQYTLDRWKVTGTGGVTFSTTDNKTTVTIPSGQTLQQVIEGLNLQTGTYVLSWEGTAQGRIAGGSYGASGAVTAAITGGANTTIEFNAGTVANVQLELGTEPTAFEYRFYGQELVFCQRYYGQVSEYYRRFDAALSNGTDGGAVYYPVRPRVVPAVSLTLTGANVSTLSVSAPTITSCVFTYAWSSFGSTVARDARVSGTYSAEL